MSLECSFSGLFLWVKFSFHVTSVAFWMAMCYTYLICIEITWNTQYVGCTFVWRFILVWLRPLSSNECYSTWWYHLWQPLSQQFVFVPHDNALKSFHKDIFPVWCGRTYWDHEGTDLNPLTAPLGWPWVNPSHKIGCSFSCRLADHIPHQTASVEEIKTCFKMISITFSNRHIIYSGDDDDAMEWLTTEPSHFILISAVGYWNLTWVSCFHHIRAGDDKYWSYLTWEWIPSTYLWRQSHVSGYFVSCERGNTVLNNLTELCCGEDSGEWDQIGSNSMLHSGKKKTCTIQSWIHIND